MPDLGNYMTLFGAQALRDHFDANPGEHGKQLRAVLDLHISASIGAGEPDEEDLVALEELEAQLENAITWLSGYTFPANLEVAGRELLAYLTAVRDADPDEDEDEEDDGWSCADHDRRHADPECPDCYPDVVF